jgi:hypothetical protein
MKTKILLTLLVVSILGGCNKDKYETKPQLKFKKVNSKSFRQGDQITFTLEVTDAEGDVQDSIFVQKRTRNCSQSTFTERYLMPQFVPGKNFKADIDISFFYNVNDRTFPQFQGPQCVGRNDSSIVRFWIKDKAKNVSDTVSSDEFVLLR